MEKENASENYVLVPFYQHFYKDFYRGLWSVFTSEFQNKGIMTQEQRRKTAGRNRRRGFITRERARDYPPPHALTAHPVMILEEIQHWGQRPVAEQWVEPQRLAGPLEFLLPLFKEGSFRGMLIIPTKSSVGTRERRIDLIRMASPFPVWISYNAGLEDEIEEWSPPIQPTPNLQSNGSWRGSAYDSTHVPYTLMITVNVKSIHLILLQAGLWGLCSAKRWSVPSSFWVILGMMIGYRAVSPGSHDRCVENSQLYFLIPNSSNSAKCWNDLTVINFRWQKVWLLLGQEEE